VAASRRPQRRLRRPAGECAAVEAILAATDVPVQLGGGIRDLATVETWLAKGIRRVILGTAAVRDPDFVREACRLFPAASPSAVDARDGKVAAAGWAETTDVSAPNSPALRGRRRRRHHLHRHRPRRHAAGPQRRGDAAPGRRPRTSR
jgi:hypothetical protein